MNEKKNVRKKDRKKKRKKERKKECALCLSLYCYKDFILFIIMFFFKPTHDSQVNNEKQTIRLKNESRRIWQPDEADLFPISLNCATRQHFQTERKASTGALL